MDNEYKLPDEYFDNLSSEDSTIDLDGKEIDIQAIDSIPGLDESNEYKMIGEEDVKEEISSPSSSKNAQVSDSNKVTTSYNEVNEKPNSVPNNSSQIVENQGNNIVYSKSDNFEAITELDKKIENLENILKGIEVTNQTDSANIVNSENNFFNSENITDNNNDSITNKIVNSENNIDQKNNTNLNTTSVKNIVNEINNLKKVKEQFETNLSNINQENISNALTDTGKVLFDNFTPNLRIDPSDSDYDPEAPKSWKKEQATQIAIETEKDMGGDPIVQVVPDIGEVVIDKKNQNNVQEAVQQHGGWNEAISDSIVNQDNFTNNFKQTSESFGENNYSNSNSDTYVNKNEKNNFESSINDTIKNEDFNYFNSIKEGGVNNFNSENSFNNMSDPNTDIVKNTGESITILSKISKQLENINNNLSKSFNHLGKSIKDIKNEQKNLYYQNVNSTSNPNFTPNQKNNEPSLIPNVRGDVPLREDFPQNFNMGELFSNLRS